MQFWENKKLLVIYHRKFSAFPRESKKLLVLFIIWIKVKYELEQEFFYFLRILKTPNNKTFISMWDINENIKNEHAIHSWKNAKTKKLTLFAINHHISNFIWAREINNTYY